MANVVTNLLRRVLPKQVLNAFNKAFYKYVGQHFTAYDTNADTYLEKGYLYNSTVFAVISQRARKAQQVPFTVKKVADKQAKAKLDSLKLATKGLPRPNQIVKYRDLEKKAFQEDFFDFPMKKPNELQTWASIIGLYETFMASTGNFFLYLLRGDFSNEPLQVYVLPSHLMQIILKPKASLLGTESPIQSYMLIEGDNFVEFEAENVIHVKYENPEYGLNGEHLYGLSPLRAALRNIQSSNYATDSNINAMLNSGVFGFLHGKGEHTLNDDQAKALKSRLKEMQASKEYLGKMAAVSAEIGFTRVAMTTDELKPFDYLQWDEKQICNVLGWDNVLLNDKTRATDNNVEQAEQRVVVNTTMPSLKLLAEAIQDQFLPSFKGYDNVEFNFDFSELPEMQQDIAELVGWLGQSLDRGVINRDTFREFLGLPKEETSEMKAYTVIQDVIPLEEAINSDFSINDPAQV